MNNNMEQLLRLQEQDIEYIQLRTQLDRAPEEISDLKNKIQSIRDEEKGLEQEVQNLEVKRKQADIELKNAEEKVLKYKTQQMEVKKSEEYEAFNAQIEREGQHISELEDQELSFLMEIDQKREALNKQKAEFKGRIGELETQIQFFENQRAELQGQVDVLAKRVEELSKEVEPALLKKYRQVQHRVKRGPYVVELDIGEHRCNGCHLKVSGETVSAVRHGNEIAQCDNCSRILYYSGG